MVDFKALSSNQKFALDVLIPLFYFLPLAVAWFRPKNFGFGYPALVPVVLGIGLIGLGLWIVATLHLGKALAVLPGSDILVAKGVYKWLRHPMYMGILFTLLGLMVACGSLFGLIYIFVVVIPLNIVRAHLEEKALLEKFGDRYQTYLQSTWF